MSIVTLKDVTYHYPLTKEPALNGINLTLEEGKFYGLIGENGGGEDDPICEYDFLGTLGFGFEVPTEDELACNFICADIEGKLFTILTTAKSYEEIDELLDLVEQEISFE